MRKGRPTRLRVGVLKGEDLERTGLRGRGAHLWRASSCQRGRKESVDSLPSLRETIVLEEIPPDATLEDEDVPFLAFLDEGCMEEIIRIPKGNLAMRTLGWHAPSGLHRCYRADVSNSDLTVAPERSHAGVSIGLGLQYTGRDAIEPHSVVLIAYGVVSRGLLQDRHESTAMLLSERVCQTLETCGHDRETLSDIYLLNDGVVSKIAFVNHSCQPSCILSTARVVHSLTVAAGDAQTLAGSVEMCDIVSKDGRDCDSPLEDLEVELATMSASGSTVKCEVLLPVLISLDEIMPGDFLSFDYAWTSTEASGPARCACGAQGCRGWLRQLEGVGKRQREDTSM